MLRQLRGDPLGLGAAVLSERSLALRPRTAEADRVVRSVYPDSPISRGRLCPKGAASRSLVTSPLRQTTVRYRRPHGTRWEELSLEQAMDMIADRLLDTRQRTWADHDEEGRRTRRTLGFAIPGGATLDNEENYLIKKLFTALGAIQMENQARI